MSEPSYIGLVQNAALLTLLVLIFDTLKIHIRRDSFTVYQVLSGVLVGIIGVSVMLTPWEYLPGVIFDTRSVLLSLSGLFFGTVPTIIAILITGAFRIYQGGGGAFTGVLVIIATGAIGMIWRIFRGDALEKITWLELYGFGLTVHLVMLALMFTLPWETALNVLSNISLPVLVIYPLASAFLGTWTSSRIAREKMAGENKREKKRFEVVADNTVDFEYWLKPDNQFEYCSPSCLALTGYSQPEFTSRPNLFQEIIDPVDWPSFEQALRMTSSGHNTSIDFRIIQKNTQVRWVNQVCKAVYDETNQWIGIRGSIRDITNQKLAENKALESQKRLADIVEFLPDATLAIDHNKRVIIWNRAMEEMTGIPSKEMLGKGENAYTIPFYGVSRPQLIDLFWLDDTTASDLYTGVEKVGNTYTVEAFCNALYGNQGAWIYAKASPLYDQEGHIIGAIESFRDISERRRTEEALRQSLNNLSRSQSIAHVGNWYFDLKENTFSASIEGYRLFEIPVDTQPTYDEVFAQIHSDDRERMRQILAETISTGAPYDEEFRIITKDSGQLRHLHSIAEIEKDAAGHPIRVFGINQDITQQKNIEEIMQAAQLELKRLLGDSERFRQALLSVIEDQREAEQKIRQLNAELEQRVAERTAQLTAANHELEAFSYSVSHDLRAPLRAIEGFSTALQEENAHQLDEQGTHYLARIQESSVRMGQLIHDLLNLSRVTRADFHRQPVNLSRLAETIAAELKEKSPQRQVRIDISSGMMVEGDNNLLRIALENLLNNAFKFSDRRELAIIDVGMVEQAGGRTFFVRDNGAGFNMEYADKLFTPFQRLHSSSEFSGTGIGLSIVQRIITRHGGRIWPEAVVGEGATFHFTLGDSEA